MVNRNRASPVGLDDETPGYRFNHLLEHSMRLKGPYLTLVGGVAVAGTLLALSTNAVRKDVDVVAASAAAATQEPTDAGTDPAQEPAATAPAQESDAVKPV